MPNIPLSENDEQKIRQGYWRGNCVVYRRPRKCQYDLKLFNEFLNSEEEERKIENIPAAELQHLAKKFVLGVRKKNGEEYEPSSLRGFLQSVDRYLRKKGCTFSLLNDKEFCEVQDILKKKQKQVKAIGKGNKPNSADALTDEEIEEFYRAGVGGSVIERVVTYKLLGVYISDDLIIQSFLLLIIFLILLTHFSKLCLYFVIVEPYSAQCYFSRLL